IARRSGSTTFWSRHCFAVSLVATDAPNENRKRANAVCKRCRTVMFPGPEGSATNHKRGLCSDGVPTHMHNVKYNGTTTYETTPRWPQPAGIFTRDKKTHCFHAFEFLKAVRHMYEKTVIQNDASSLGMEYEAFADMLLQRAKRSEDGNMLFRLFPQLQLSSSTPSSLLVMHEGQQYLRIDCLRDS
ncbi:hypothetical protein BDW22DRAFT_1326664, partial [Trametopsis cervina]